MGKWESCGFSLQIEESMTPEEFKQARLDLGYTTHQELAEEWGLGAGGRRTIGRWELPRGHKESRPVPPLAAYALKLMAENE